MAKASAFQRLLRRSALILLVGVAAALVYVWMYRTPSFDAPQVFDRIYQASAIRASADLHVAAALGLPIHYSRDIAQYKFYYKDGHRHVSFQFPLKGTRRAALIKGEAVMLGKNWLVVKLIATFPGYRFQINLTPGIYT